MQGPDTLIRVVGPLEKGQACERGFGQVKTLGSIFRQESLELPFLLGRGHTLPVVLPPREFYPSVHDLQRFVASLPVESSAQDRVPIHDVLPGLREGRDVQITIEGAAPL